MKEKLKLREKEMNNCMNYVKPSNFLWNWKVSIFTLFLFNIFVKKLMIQNHLIRYEY